MSEEDIKKEASTEGAAKESASPNADSAGKEPVVKPIWNRTAMVIFFIAAFALVGVWYMAAEQQNRRASAHDIVKNMNQIKASTLMVFSNPANWELFPVGSRIKFTNDFSNDIGLGGESERPSKKDFTKYEVIHTPEGLFVAYQGDATESGVLRELTAMNKAEGLYKTASVEGGYYNEGGAAPVYLLIKAAPARH